MFRNKKQRRVRAGGLRKAAEEGKCYCSAWRGGQPSLRECAEEGRVDGAQTERQGTQGLDGGAFFLFSHCLFSFLGLGKVLSVGKSPKQRGNAVLLRPKSSSWVWSEEKTKFAALESMVSQPFAVSYKIHMYMLGNSLHMSWFLLHTKH